MQFLECGMFSHPLLSKNCAAVLFLFVCISFFFISYYFLCALLIIQGCFFRRFVFNDI